MLEQGNLLLSRASSLSAMALKLSIGPCPLEILNPATHTGIDSPGLIFTPAGCGSYHCMSAYQSLAIERSLCRSYRPSTWSMPDWPLPVCVNCVRITKLGVQTAVDCNSSS